MEKLAIVILNWNGAAMLRQFLPSVVECAKGRAAVVVADNASTDDSVSVVESTFPSVRVIRLSENFGFAEGYNRALEQVEAEYYVLLNSDVEVTEGWIAPLIDFMDANPDVAACQPKIMSQRHKTVFEYAGACGGWIDRYGYPFCRGRILSEVETDEGQYDTVADVFWATGAALMIRSADYRAVGGLDPRFFAHMEEIDLCWRLRSRGRRIVCVPESKVYHVGAATLKKESPRKTFLNFRNNLLMLYKNLPENELRSVMMVRRLLDYVAAMKFLASCDLANFRAVIKARREYARMQPSFESQRRENMKLTTADVIPERTSWSILVKFYFHRCRTFSSLFR